MAGAFAAAGKAPDAVVGVDGAEPGTPPAAAVAEIKADGDDIADAAEEAVGELQEPSVAPDDEALAHVVGAVGVALDADGPTHNAIPGTAAAAAAAGVRGAELLTTVGDVAEGD